MLSNMGDSADRTDDEAVIITSSFPSPPTLNVTTAIISLKILEHNCNRCCHNVEVT